MADRLLGEPLLARLPQKEGDRVILGYLLFLPYLIEYKVRCLVGWIKRKVKR